MSNDKNHYKHNMRLINGKSFVRLKIGLWHFKAENIYIYAGFPMYLFTFQIKVWFLTGLLFWDWLKGQKLICTSAQCMTVCRKARRNFNVLGLKSVNLQYITLGCLDDGTNELLTKSLMFQVLFVLYFL